MKRDQKKGYLKKELEVQFEIAVDDEVMDAIDDFYLSERKTHIFDLALYRFINVFFAIVFLVLFWMLKGTKFSQWLFVILMAVFLVYNAIMCWNNFMDFKSERKSNFKPFTVGEKS